MTEQKSGMTEGERLDQAKRDARARAAAGYEREERSPEDYQHKVIKDNIAAISKDLEEITKAALEDGTGVLRKDIMRWLRFILRSCKEMRKRL